MHFFTGIHSEYHRPGDDTETINASGAGRVIEMIAAITADLRETPEAPQYVAIAESRPSRTGLKVRMGVMPSYAEDEQAGMQIDGVSPGSPAEKAGLKSGDRLLMIGDTSINNVYDLMDAMAKYEPGNEANLTVLRTGERIQMAVKFEAP
jgi:S1-C subfamily serine protease